MTIGPSWAIRAGPMPTYCPISSAARPMRTAPITIAGGDGPLHTSNLRSRHPLAEKFVEAAIATGLPTNSDFNGKTQFGAGFVQANQIFGRRHSAADAYLSPVRGRKNLCVISKAQVSRVLIDNRVATGVEY